MTTPSVLQDFLPSKLTSQRNLALPAALQVNLRVLRVLSFTAGFVPTQMGQQSNKCGVMIKIAMS